MENINSFYRCESILRHLREIFPKHAPLLAKFFHTFFFSFPLRLHEAKVTSYKGSCGLTAFIDRFLKSFFWISVNLRPPQASGASLQKAITLESTAFNSIICFGSLSLSSFFYSSCENHQIWLLSITIKKLPLITDLTIGFKVSTHSLHTDVFYFTFTWSKYRYPQFCSLVLPKTPTSWFLASGEIFNRW